MDDSGEPLIGATVRVQGTTAGTITDFDGLFSISDVADDAIVEVSYMGYLPQQQKAAADMRIVLQEDVQQMVRSCLTGRDYEVIALRYGLNGEPPCTLEQIGGRYHISRERVRQIEARAMQKMMRAARRRGLVEYVS